MRGVGGGSDAALARTRASAGSCVAARTRPPAVRRATRRPRLAGAVKGRASEANEVMRELSQESRERHRFSIAEPDRRCAFGVGAPRDRAMHDGRQPVLGTRPMTGY